MSIEVIYAGSITNMSDVPGHPVFMVTLGAATAPSLVVKGEQVAGDETEVDITLSARWAGKLMKHVNNPDAAVKPLSPPEMTEFRKFATAKFGANSEACRNFNDRRVWVKMKYVPNLFDAEFTKKVPKLGKPLQDVEIVEKKKLKKLVSLFLKNETWKQLGRVVAVDLFNTNLDRFKWTSAQQVSVANEGNILFAFAEDGDAGRTVVLGLDAFHAGEANQSGANLNQPLDRFPSARIGLDILRAHQSRQAFALSCTRAVAEQIRNRMQATKKNDYAKTAFYNIELEDTHEVVQITIENVLDLYSEGVDPFATGLEEGMNELRDYLLRKKRDYEPPPQPQPQPQRGFVPVQQRGGPIQPGVGGRGAPLFMGGQRQGPQGGAGLPNQGGIGLPNQGGAGVPNLGGQRPGPPQGGPMVQQGPVKTLPRGVLDRMEYLQWR